jgi:hypothetical protein
MTDFSKKLAIKIINILNSVFGKSKEIYYEKNILSVSVKEKAVLTKDSHMFFILTFISGFIFSISITFLYYLTFYYPARALTLNSYSQIINMFGSLILILLIDPKVMSLIDKGEGVFEIKLLTISRILVHMLLVFILFLIK